ncbi:hypothetical protein [Streptomyces sp. NPDC003023]|uniref:hypothetical protein n=1 Tax=Streptomyces sp. NPDC003023 TaxID=3364675 RepID=UPI0036805839
MNAMQQHMIDVYRAAQRGDTPPPLPGGHDTRVLGEARTDRRVRAVLAGRSLRTARGARAAAGDRRSC